MFTSAVILAAGSGRRMGFDKMTAELHGKAVILYSLERFIESHADEIIIAASEDNIAKIRELISENVHTDKPIKVITGGATRFESALKAVKMTSDKCDVVSIHDGARPFLTAELADDVAQSAYKHGAALVAVRAKDTVKVCGDGVVTATPDRSTLWLAQTPQAARKADYIAAAEKLDVNDPRITDDASVMELYGIKPFIVEGSYDNIKLTTKEDIAMAESIIGKSGAPKLRVGHGYDVHRLVEGRKLILCGVEVPNKDNIGLLGHSDADVAVHALMDAMLGAVALGDIGKHFPDSDDRYKGISSMRLLEHVRKLLDEKNSHVTNADITIIAEKPKLAKFIPDMRESIAAALGLETDDINVKATTEEGLGIAGAGIAAHAVCMVEKIG
ncbi:MAG: 2-C-methyl-D-erythritol 2,4-cyclodiphosphate synthase [Ruminiclostridium sp.]|nr:2-C-methyl-D-erythritol 2,4-cyclodiphosphate synthase [Ruminiclostridium sp.]